MSKEEIKPKKLNIDKNEFVIYNDIIHHNFNRYNMFYSKIPTYFDGKNFYYTENKKGKFFIVSHDVMKNKKNKFLIFRNTDKEIKTILCVNIYCDYPNLITNFNFFYQKDSICLSFITYLGEYNDRTHRFFNGEIRDKVFKLMCIRERINNENIDFPRLPIELWLNIFHFLI